MSTGVKLEAVARLLDREFFIRSYQRGYRWDSDHVNDLLNDFEEFIKQPNKAEEEFYCLQPIVVKQLSGEEKKKLDRFEFGEAKIYEIIDGQQRITTLTILLHYLKKSLEHEVFLENIPVITYEVREKSKEILSNFSKYIDSTEAFSELENNIDFYHMKVAYATISKWFEEKQERRIQVLKLLTSYKINCVKVIWYEVAENDNSIDVFRRFNVGKIPLSNAELIKALFLKGNEHIEHSLRYRISKEWQQIENQLQSRFFWAFLKPKKEYSSRIEYIFDIIFERARRKMNRKDPKSFDDLYGVDKHRVFRYFSLWIEETRANLMVVWDQINEVFERFLQWYNHPEHYHYIGFLQNKEGDREVSILDILSSEFDTKQDLTDFLIEKVSNGSNSFFKDKKIVLDYKSDKKQLRDFFFLFNVQSYIQLSKSSKGEEIYRLPFNLFSSIDYDIEHIDSRTEKDIKSLKRNQKLEFLKDLEIDFSSEIGNKFYENISPLFKVEYQDTNEKWDEKNINVGELEKILENTIELINEYLERDSDKLDGDSKDHIGNLTILNDTINRGYGNAYFSTKRRLIIESDIKGTYIPVAVKNIFLKYYSGDTKKHTRWSKKDAENYQARMEESLKIFMK